MREVREIRRVLLNKENRLSSSSLLARYRTSICQENDVYKATQTAKRNLTYLRKDGSIEIRMGDHTPSSNLNNLKWKK